MIKYQSNLKAFERVPHSAWQSLETIAARVNIKQRDYIFQANFSNNTVYLLLEGRVKLSRLSDQGQECIQWFCFPGELFGFSEYTYNHDSGLYAQALTPVVLLQLSRQDFEQLVKAAPELGLIAIEQLSRRVRTLGDMLLHIASGNAQDRLINLLQRLSEIYGRPAEQKVNIDIHLTHQEIADMIGVCRQTVSTLMASMKKNGLISSNRQGIVIHNLAHLNTVSQQVPLKQINL